MNVAVNTIVTLDNDERYVVLSEAIYQDNKYFLVMGFNDRNEVDAKNVAIFQEDIVGYDVYLVKIEDASLLSILMKILKSQL